MATATHGVKGKRPGSTVLVQERFATGAPSGRTQPRGASGPRPYTTVFALVPMLAALGIGWAGAGQRQMWNNEYATWHAATLSLPDLGNLLSNTDLVHTAYILLIKCWIAVAGDTPLALRLPSMVAMSLAAGFLALLGRRLINTPVGVVAGLLFAGIPAVSRYAQEARSYALVTMMVVLSTLLLARAMDKPGRLRWALYGVGVVATGWLHFASLVVMAAHLVLVARTADRDDPRRYQWAGAAGVAGLGIIPLLSFASRQSASISWIKADLAAVRVFPRELFLSWQAAGAVVALGFLGVVLLARTRRPAMWTLVVWAVLPIVFVYVTYPVLHMFLARYVLYTLPAWSLLAAAAVCGIGGVLVRRERSWTWLLGAVLVLPGYTYLVLPDHHAVRASPVTGQPDYRAAIDVIRERMQQGDGIAYNDVFGALSDLAREAVDYEMRDGPKPRDVFVLTSSVARGSYSAKECSDAAACLGDTIRIWVISTNYSPDPLVGLPAERLQVLRAFKVTPQGTFKGVRLVLLTQKGA